METKNTNQEGLVIFAVRCTANREEQVLDFL